jgi:hypothetical protein
MPAGKHSSDKKSPSPATEPDFLDDNQARRLRVTCHHIDRILSEIEGILNETNSLAAFPSYIADITPEQQRTIENYIASVRTQLTRALEKQGISSTPPGVPVSRAIRSRLYSIDISAEEIKSRHMRGYGKISPAATTELNSFAGELQSQAIHLERYLAGKNSYSGKD